MLPRTSAAIRWTSSPGRSVSTAERRPTILSALASPGRVNLPKLTPTDIERAVSHYQAGDSLATVSNAVITTWDFGLFWRTPLVPSLRETTGERRAIMRRDLGFVGSTALMLSGRPAIGAVISGCTSTPSSSSTTQTTAAPTTTVTSIPLPVTSTTSQANVGLGQDPPLWPFDTSGEVQAWEQSNSSGGHQPWHLDAGITAQSFVTGYLGFTDIDTVVHTTIDSSGAHVAIGFVTAGTSTSTAAVIHMVRWGTSPSAPWEVVGTDDTSLVLYMPAYGSTVTSPMTVGGTITGVDEQLVATGASVRVIDAPGSIDRCAGRWNQYPMVDSSLLRWRH